MSKTKFTNWTAAMKPSVRIDRIRGYPSKLKKVFGDPRMRVGTFYGDMRALAERYGYAGDLTSHEYRVFSQNGEDGVIAEIVRRVGNQFPRVFVEFGAAMARAGNCVFLADALGWEGLFIEPATADFAILKERYAFTDRVRTVCEFVEPGNIDRLIADAGFTKVGVMSIDIDGNDFYVWEALKVRPVLVLIEYNGGLPLREVLVQPFSGAPWDGSNYFGCSLGALKELAARKNYLFVHSELTGTNAFFVAGEYADRFADILNPPERSANYELLGITHPEDEQHRSYRTDI
jgi:hypothetical protein